MHIWPNTYYKNLNNNHYIPDFLFNKSDMFKNISYP